MNIFGKIIFVSFCVTWCFIIGVLVSITDYEKDNCEMTYMFEYPQFVRVPHQFDKNYTKYGLYVYSEGRLTGKARDMYFDGIPVLFIPGNAGSHKQVRSLSSVALRKALNSRVSFHFDYFTVDLNGEFTGLSGSLLYHQLEYVNSSIYRILELYKYNVKNPPKSVIVVGHSMGGVVALKLLTTLPENSNLIPLVINLAAPLKKPTIIFDKNMRDFYEMTSIPKTSTVVSVSGGFRDCLVPVSLTQITGNNTINAVGTQVPRTWVEMDHVQIVWCKQLILALNRALFDSVDQNTKQISLNGDFRKMVFEHHLIHHSGIKIRSRSQYDHTTKFDHNGDWIESLYRQYTINLLNGVKKPHWYMVGLTKQPNYEILTVFAVNLEIRDWINVCSAAFPKGPSRVCVDGLHLSHLSEMAPSVKYKRRFITVNMHELKKNNSELTHVVFRALPTSEPLVYHVDVYNSAERKKTVDLPDWFSYKKHVIISKTIEKSIRYDLELSNFVHVMQYYQFFVEPLTCNAVTHHATASLVVPWDNTKYHAYFTETEKKPFNVRLFSSKPKNANSAILTLLLDPLCTYRVSVKSSYFGIWAQFARHYTPFLFANAGAVILLSLRHQLGSIKKAGRCSVVFLAVGNNVASYLIPALSTIFIIVSREINLPDFIPQPDDIGENGVTFFVMSILLYLCAVGIVWIVAIFLMVSLVALESTVNKIVLKFLAKTVIFSFSWSDYLLSFIQKVPIFMSMLLVFLSVSTCGGLALLVGAVFYFLKLTQLSQDYIEEITWVVIKNVTKKFKNYWRRKKDDKKEEEEPQNEQILDKSADVEEKTNEQDETIETKEESMQRPKNDEEEEESPIESNETVKTKEQGVNQPKNDKDEEEDSQAESNEILDKQNNSDETPDDETKEQPKNEEFVQTHNALFFHSTIFLIWFLLTCINIPSVITWAHNFKHSSILLEDESFIPGFLLSLCAFPLWQLDLPRIDRGYLDEIQRMIAVYSGLCLMYATVCVYKLNYFLTIIVVLVTCQQVFCPSNHGTDDDDDDDDSEHKDKDGHVKYEQVKKKLE